jgi:P2 family phage contractile tail tube protein
MALLINQITNFNMYANGQDYLGRIKEFMIEDPKFKTADHSAIGLFGTLEFPTGMDKLTGSLTWASQYDTKALFANPFVNIKVQIRGSLETYDSTGRTTEVPYEIDATLAIINNTGVNARQHENMEPKQSFNLYYIKEQINGVDITEIDVMKNIFNVSGSDVLSKYRANLGI